MGWFFGHLLPGLAWLSMGVFHLAQSYNHFPVTNALRKRPIWLAFRSFMLLIFACTAITIESIDEAETWGASNTQHMIMWTGLAMSAILEFFLLINFISDPFLSLIPPMGMCYISIMLVLHAQKVVFWSYLHIYSGVVVGPLFLVFAIGQHIRYSSIKKSTLPYPDKPASVFMGKNKIEDLNPYYTDESAYDTMAPGLASFLIVLEAISWIEMAFQMGPYDAETLPDDPADPALTIWSVVAKNFIYACLFCWLVSYIFKSLNERKGYELNLPSKIAGEESPEKNPHIHHI